MQLLKKAIVDSHSEKREWKITQKFENRWDDSLDLKPSRKAIKQGAKPVLPSKWRDISESLYERTGVVFSIESLKKQFNLEHQKVGETYQTAKGVTITKFRAKMLRRARSIASLQQDLANGKTLKTANFNKVKAVKTTLEMKTGTRLSMDSVTNILENGFTKSPVFKKVQHQEVYNALVESVGRKGVRDFYHKYKSEEEMVLQNPDLFNKANQAARRKFYEDHMRGWDDDD